ncbi:MAG TPA: oligopeptide:H+ symporter [Steroidobacteraceae bacterium]|nr:oligopeptide:H+ symporter [Steroidobacteraceae bacterium]
MSTETIAAPAAGKSDAWGHPRQLWMLLAVTVGLNFGFYGFRAYLAPYIEKSFFSGLGAAAAQRNADLLSSGFLALMYATPIIGGYIADKILGEARALAIALWLGTLSLILMALPTLFGFELGLALFALAQGLGIPLTVLIGRNYAQDDPRREGAYTLYYLAINFAGFVAPLLCADLVGRRFGYRSGFLASAVGMAFAAVVFQWRKHKLQPRLAQTEPPHGVRAALWVIVAIAVLVWPTALLVSHPQVLSTAMYGLMGLLVLYFFVRCRRRRDRVQTERYLALLVLFVAMVLFWTLSFQGVTSLNFFARDYVDAPFDYTLFQAANPLYILIFAPLLALLWPWLDRRGKDPSTPRKFGIGLLLVALSYGLTVAAIRYATAPDGKVGWSVLAGCYLLQTLGELALSPIGYSLVGLLAAPDEGSLAMGGWFFGVALAYQLAGWIATLTTMATRGAQAGIAAYAGVYEQLFVVGLIVSLVYLLAAPGVRKLMRGVH